MSSRDGIYFNREEYNKSIQIISDNKNSKNEKILRRANQLNEKFESYSFIWKTNWRKNFIKHVFRSSKFINKKLNKTWLAG